MTTTEAIRISYFYIIKHAFKLFDDESRLGSLQQLVTNLRLTSKDLNNSLCDELSLEIMLRWMKGRDRCARVSQRIEQLLQKNDANGLIKFMDLVTKIFSKRESVRMLSSFLVTITQHHKHLLKAYMDFFNSRKLHMTIKEYFERIHDFPFPGFGLEQVEKSLQIANENGWKEESLLLLNLYLQNWPNELLDHLNIKEAISKGVKLNFDNKVANRLKNLYRHRDAAVKYLTRTNEYRGWLWLYLNAKEITTSDVMKILHNVSKGPARDLLMVMDKISSKRRCHVISFEGSQLIRFFYRARTQLDNFQQTFYSISSPPKIFTGLTPAPKDCQRTYLYPYYRAVVENDIETAKRIHREKNIVLKDFGYQPHPLLEYIKALGREIQLTPMQEMIDYLVQNFGGIKECLTGIRNITSTDVVARLWPTIRPLIYKGAMINNILIWKLRFFENIPRNVRAFRALLDGTDKTDYLKTQIMYLMLDKFSRTKGVFSEKKLLLLLAWKYDSKCRLSKLPIGPLKIILKFIDEPPLFIQYAAMAIEDITSTYSEIIDCSMEHNQEIAKFVRVHADKIGSTALWHLMASYTTEKAVKRDAKYLRELVAKLYPSAQIFPTKMYRYFCKYETDERVLKQLVEFYCNWTSSGRHCPLLEYAVVANNTKLLHEFYSKPQNINIVLNEEVFASVAPNRKNKMSYKQAVELIDEVRSQHRPKLNQITM